MRINLKKFQPEIATCHQHLGHLHQLENLENTYEKSELNHKKALDIRKRIYKPPHSYIAHSLNNLANLYQYNKPYRYAEAMDLYMEALEMNRQLYGSIHNDIARNLNNLGNLYSKIEPSKAIPLYEQALKIYQHLFGEEDSSVIKILQKSKIIELCMMLD